MKFRLRRRTKVKMMGITDDRDNPELDIVDPDTGMQMSYLVLSDEELAKGFVRPVRRSYRHVGRPGPQHEVRDLTPEELERYAGVGYVAYEKYPEDDAITGKFWTQTMLDRRTGCGAVTTMGQTLAETYARDPKFYGGTYCARCQAHYPVGPEGEFVWDGTDVKVGT